MVALLGAVFLLAATAHAANMNESWSYVDVRPGAHMFYWLYEAAAPNQPLVRVQPVFHVTVVINRASLAMMCASGNVAARRAGR